EKGLLFGPGKAANAGGVATSGLEMSQNSQRLSWTREQVDEKLKAIMVKIHNDIQETSKEFALEGNYVAGANITGFRKVADTMIALGIL
ncbi:MAG: glutamate dehydrogenase, partial [bacterium]